MDKRDHLAKRRAEALTKEYRRKAEALEAHLAKLPQVEVPLEHYFSPGVYVREIRLPKDTVATGRVHKGVTMTIIVSGDITVAGPDGPTRLTGYHVLVGNPLDKRVVYAHEDTIWLNVLANPDDEKDIAVLEDRYVAKTFKELEAPDKPGELTGEVK